MKAGHGGAAPLPLPPPPPRGLADNGNPIRGERVGGGADGGLCSVFCEELFKAPASYLSTELFVTESSTVILTLLFLGRAIIASVPLAYPRALCERRGEACPLLKEPEQSQSQASATNTSHDHNETTTDTKIQTTR